MKQKNLILIIAILIILGISLFIAFYPREKSDIKSHPCDSSEFEEALNKSNVSLCELVPQSTEIVNGVKYPYYDNYCRESCIAALAYKKGDANLCALINSFKDIPHVEGWVDPRETGSVKDHCYIQLAPKLGNVSLCNNVETDWAKLNCPHLYETDKDRQY